MFDDNNKVPNVAKDILSLWGGVPLRSSYFFSKPNAIQAALRRSEVTPVLRATSLDTQEANDQGFLIPSAILDGRIIEDCIKNPEIHLATIDEAIFVNAIELKWPSAEKIIFRIQDNAKKTDIFYLVSEKALSYLKEKVALGYEKKPLEIESTPISVTESLKRQGQYISSLPSMTHIYNVLNKFAPTDINILLEGSTGTGKEALARAVHECSSVSSGSFVKLDCTSPNESIFESKLFGHVKGAFTGAAGNRAGLIAQANGGTLFLDEIGHLPKSSQAMLLCVIQDREYYPVGSDKPQEADMRIIAACSQNPKNSLSKALYHRLDDVPITVPSLKNRKPDIPELANHFASVFGEKYNGEPSILTSDVHDMLQEKSWEGNIRELQKAVKAAVVMSEGSQIKPNDFLFR